VTLPATVILAVLTLQPVPTGNAEQTCFRSDITRQCWVISVQSNTQLLRQCECPSNTVVIPGDSARRNQKQVMHFMLPSLKRLFAIYGAIEAVEYNHPCISPFFMAPDANSSPIPL